MVQWESLGQPHNCPIGLPNTVKDHWDTFGVAERWVQEGNAQLQQLPKELAGGQGLCMSLLEDTLWGYSKELQIFTKQNREKDHLVLPLRATSCYS